MNGTSSPAAATVRLELIPTQVGFELIADSNDWVSKLLLRDQIYEAPETDLVTRLVRPGDTCIDAGCHIGYYSCLFARLAGEKGRVYSFDANPNACANTRRNLGLNGFTQCNVIHAALAEVPGMLSFHISSDDQTGLSSLGPISTIKEVISVPALALGMFIRDRQIDGVRLLKIDVEGAEEILLRGLGPTLSHHVIDYILVECFDERLQLLDTSSQKVANILLSAGYVPWEYRVDRPAGWSAISEVRSRGDCNYLFVSPSVTATFARVTITGALTLTQVQKAQAASLLESVKEKSDADIKGLQANIDKLQGDIDWLLESIKTHEQQVAGLTWEKRQLETLLTQIQGSAGWRILNKWRRLRNSLAPESTLYRKVYDAVLGNLRKP